MPTSAHTQSFRRKAATTFELPEMEADKEGFLRSYHANSLPSQPVVRTTDFFKVLPAIADKALCAEVRFLVDFEDGSRVWLAECTLRPPSLTLSEQTLCNKVIATPAATRGPAFGATSASPHTRKGNGEGATGICRTKPSAQ